MISTSRAVFLFLGALAAAGCAANRRGGDDDDDSSVENCANGYDEDGDRLVDCFDPDCAADPVCVRTENCTNLIDDDGDTLVDCDDPACAADPTCAPEPESNCANQLDDDGDGDADCDDSDCAASPACQQVVDGDCEALCDRAQQCGRAEPGCVDSCQCTVDEVYAPEFSESFYACMLEADCSVFDDSMPCFSQAELSQTSRADSVAASCQGRGDCQGIDCNFFRIFNDDTLQTIESCWRGGDCFTCLENAASTCGP